MIFDVTQEEYRHNADEQETQRQILLKIGDGIVQQLRLVTADAKINVGIYFLEVVHRCC